MPNLRLPADGLTILHDHSDANTRHSNELPQIFQLDAVENVTKEILRSLRNNEQVRLKLGKKPAVQYGKTQLKLRHASDTFPSEILVGPLDGSNPIYFTGKLSHSLEIQQAKDDTAGTDEALANLENNLKSLHEQKVSNGASFMVGKSDAKKKDIKSAPLSTRDRLRGGTTPSSPFMGTSPRFGATSNSFLPSMPSKEKIRQDAMRIPMVHLLAMSPMSAKDVARKLNASQTDCDKVLDKIAKDGMGGVKELKEKCFRELDVWKFPYRSDEDRNAAVDRAIHAYDRMRIDKNDQLWQLLLPHDKRGKGVILSRLNFVKLTQAPTPRLGPDGDTKAEISDKEGKIKKTKPVSEPKDVLHKKKPSGDTTSRKKGDKSSIKTAAQSTKPESKFKSSERIEDSDEETAGVEVIPAKPTGPRVKERNTKTLPVSRNTSHAHVNSNTNINGQHKSKLSSSSSGSTDLERPHLRDEGPQLKQRSQAERPISTSRISPRPRTDSSPQKPSPLGSSPPTNSTDLENSSKSSIQSSAPSSPPSSMDMPLSQARKNYSPVIAGKGRNVSAAMKRKNEKGEEPPPKRQQIHGLGLSKTLTDKIQHTLPQRRTSNSSTSSPEKHAPTKENVVDATVKFREYYAKYKDLHIRLNRLDPDDRPDRDLDQLWKWHERLERLKSDLWSDWAKAGGEVSV